jgi:hypothetical protein
MCGLAFSAVQETNPLVIEEICFAFGKPVPSDYYIPKGMQMNN